MHGNCIVGNTTYQAGGKRRDSTSMHGCCIVVNTKYKADGTWSCSTYKGEVLLGTHDIKLMIHGGAVHTRARFCLEHTISS